MRRFLWRQVFFPLASHWLQGILLLMFWTASFILLPALSAWFLAMCSVAFMASGAAFQYLIPASVIRLLTLLRTAARYFSRMQNHQNTLEAQRNLQLNLFSAMARLPYVKKQAGNFAFLLDKSIRGIDTILNYIILWILPFYALLISVILYFVFLRHHNDLTAWVFLISSAVLLLVLPQWAFFSNRKYHRQQKTAEEEQLQSLIESFQGKIEITKDHLSEKAFERYRHNQQTIDRLEERLFRRTSLLQWMVGLGFTFLALVLLALSPQTNLSPALGIGILFGILAQADLAEMLFNPKTDRNVVKEEVDEIGRILAVGSDQPQEQILEPLENLTIEQLSATIPDTSFISPAISIQLKKGSWTALYGATGSGKTTLLNSLFFPEYRNSGKLFWNGNNVAALPVPQSIYVTQNAFLLTGTLWENFEGLDESEIVNALQTVDLLDWYRRLPEGLHSWIGEGGSTLSGGQRKKMLLAQALLKKPQLLVVDEITAGISVDNAISIFRNIRSYFPQLTVLMTTHAKQLSSEFDTVINLG